MIIHLMTYQTTKVRLFLIMLLMVGISCHRERGDATTLEAIRFEKILFEAEPQEVIDTFHSHLLDIRPFFDVFNEEIILIGPDTLPEYPESLESFTNDPILIAVYDAINQRWSIFSKQIGILNRGLQQMERLTGLGTPTLVTYLSGFNESFITLPGLLGVGLDKYLGSDCSWYKELRIPEYIRSRMNPENLASDAMKAWLMSELEPPALGSSFLDHLLYHGKIQYLLQESLPRIPKHIHFHFTEEQLKWCEEHEQEMWRYLAENRILFSTERMMIRKFHEDAPFTSDFGHDSPGKTGCWIGYQVIHSYLKATRQGPEVLFEEINSQEILSKSRYRP